MSLLDIRNYRDIFQSATEQTQEGRWITHDGRRIFIPDKEPLEKAERPKQLRQVQKLLVSFVNPNREVKKYLGGITQEGEEVASRIKTPESVVGKMSRKDIDLSEVKDIAGSRISVGSIDRQREIIDQIKNYWKGKIIEEDHAVDKPKLGYLRQGQFYLRVQGKPIEVQVRTYNQTEFASWIRSNRLYKGPGSEHAKEPVYQNYLKALGQYTYDKDVGKSVSPPKAPKELKLYKPDIDW